jgi:thioredoxin 1
MEIIIIILAVVALVAGYLIYQFRKIRNMPPVEDSKHVITLTDANYMSKISKGVVLIDLWAAWCMPCKMIAPVINEIADEFQGRLLVCKLNVDEQRKAAQAFGARSIPTLVILKNGKEVERIVGVKNKPQLIKQIEKWL